MRLRELIFAVTGVKDAQAREAITRAWRERGQLERGARRGYPAPEAAKASRGAMLAWVLLTLAQDEPNFFALGLLALLTLPLFALLTALSVFKQHG